MHWTTQVNHTEKQRLPETELTGDSLLPARLPFLDSPIPPVYLAQDRLTLIDT